MQSIFKVTGSVQNYRWGGQSFIPKLLNRPVQANTPTAEYWLGTHKSGPATVSQDKQTITLVEHLKNRQQQPLPFLFKVLDVESMLSIQVHPNKDQATEGFKLENQKGISPDASHRNYKDNNDKPELMVALSPFWLLHGIASQQDIHSRLKAKPYLKKLADTVLQRGIRAAFRLSLNANDESVQQMHDSLARDLLQRDTHLNGSVENKNTLDYWVGLWIHQNPNTLNGILSLYLMNLVTLETGDAIYQPPGLLHAYLGGQNVELMANSDNVLRAGLTPKHIDVDELLRIGQFEPTAANDYLLVEKIIGNERVFKTPFEAFELSKFHNPASSSDWTTKTPELLFCLRGQTTLSNTDGGLTLHAGEAAIICGGVKVQLHPGDQHTYRVKTP